MQASDCEAKASFNSIISISLISNSALLRAFKDAPIGPNPINSGGHPLIAVDFILAKIGKLFDHFYEINAGIGAHKSPKLYGAFPTDPYSHTPAGRGAQQPGMTGQVKEDILCRFGELGYYVKKGCLGFYPDILNLEEFILSLIHI